MQMQRSRRRQRGQLQCWQSCLAATSLLERILISCKRICLQLPSSAACPAVLLAVGVAGGDRVVCMANARRFMARSSRGQLATQSRRHKLAPTAANRCRQQQGAC